MRPKALKSGRGQPHATRSRIEFESRCSKVPRSFSGAPLVAAPRQTPRLAQRRGAVEVSAGQERPQHPNFAGGSCCRRGVDGKERRRIYRTRFDPHSRRACCEPQDDVAGVGRRDFPEEPVTIAGPRQGHSSEGQGSRTLEGPARDGCFCPCCSSAISRSGPSSSAAQLLSRRLFVNASSVADMSASGSCMFRSSYRKDEDRPHGSMVSDHVLIADEAGSTPRSVNFSVDAAVSEYGPRTAAPTQAVVGQNRRAPEADGRPTRSRHPPGARQHHLTELIYTNATQNE